MDIRSPLHIYRKLDKALLLGYEIRSSRIDQIESIMIMPDTDVHDFKSVAPTISQSLVKLCESYTENKPVFSLGKIGGLDENSIDEWLGRGNTFRARNVDGQATVELLTRDGTIALSAKRNSFQSAYTDLTRIRLHTELLNRLDAWFGEHKNELFEQAKQRNPIRI